MQTSEQPKSALLPELHAKALSPPFATHVVSKLNQNYKIIGLKKIDAPHPAIRFTPISYQMTTQTAL